MEYGYRVQHTVSTKGLFTNDVGIFWGLNNVSISSAFGLPLGASIHK